MQVKLEHPLKSSNPEELNTTSFSVPVPFDIKGNSTCKVKVMNLESPVVQGEAVEVAYEGEDEHEENSSIKREFSDFDLQAHVANAGEEEFQSRNKNMKYSDSFDTEVNAQFEDKFEKDAEEGVHIIQNGHVSDPGIPKADFWASPKLKRSCSNLESRDMLKKISGRLPPSKSHSFEELQGLADGAMEGARLRDPGSPGSVMSRRSADRVMLKKRSSSQVLPSRSRRLWWKLFLWSHRNLHKPRPVKPPPLPITAAFNQQGGYCSDSIEPNRALQLSEMESPGSFTGHNHQNDNQSWDGFHGGTSSLWPQNHWVAFPAESSWPFARVDEWVKDLGTQPPFPFDNDDKNVEDIIFPPSPETGRSPSRNAIHPTRHPNANLSEEILHANSVIQSLNSSSTVAHITGIGLKAIPTISHFSSLRSVNLSSNYIGVYYVLKFKALNYKVREGPN